MATGKRPLSLGERGSSQANANTRAITIGQMVFGGMVLVVILLTFLLTASGPNELSYLGASILLLVSALTFILPLPWHPRVWMPWLMYLDIIGLGVMQAALPEVLTGLLWVFPIGWLGSMRRARYVVLGLAIILAIMLFAVFPQSEDAPARALAIYVLVPVIMLSVGAAAVHNISQRARRVRDSQRRQSRLLAQALGQAKSHELLLEEIIEAVAFGIVVIDSDGEISMMNDAQRRFDRMRVAPEDIYAADGFTRLEPTERPLERALAGEQLSREVVWYGPPEHERVALSASSVNLVGGLRPANGVLMLYQDVTAEINAIRARDDLIGSLSHELRNPLTSVIGYLELALEEELPERARARLEVAERNAERLMQLITRIVESANTAAASLTIRPEPVDLVPIVLEAAEDQQARARETGIELSVEAPAKLTAEVDSERIRQVLDNLIANAIKYNRDGGHVRLQLSKDGDRARVRVSDTGVGISADELGHVFERHFRSERVRNSSVHGNGLGLYFSQQIVQLHRGEIELESAPEVGTTATIELPLKQPELARPAGE